MSSVNQSPALVQKSVFRSVNWSDPQDVQSFLFDIRTLVSDIQGAAEDQLRPRRQRRLGHLEAKRILQEAFSKLDEALRVAERELPEAA